MKKVLKMAVYTSCLVLLATSCTSNSNDINNSSSNNDIQTSTQSQTTEVSTTEQTESSKSPESHMSSKTTEINASSEVQNEFTEVASYLYDMDSDGEDESVILTVDAQRSSNGELSLNDGQKWQLYVKDNENYFVLVDEYIQNGSVYFEIMDYYENNTSTPTIVATEDTGASLTLSAYTYNPNKNCFVERELYNSNNESKNGINKIYSSISEVK